MERFRSVLFVETHPRGAGRGFSAAARVAASHGAALTVLHVVRGPSREEALAPGAAQRREATLRRHRRLLTPRVAKGEALGVRTSLRVLVGDPTEDVLATVREGRHDLVIKVAEERDVLRAWRPHPTDGALLRECPCPLWLLDPAQHGGVRHVVAAVDVSDGRSERLNRRILHAAAEVADGEGADLHVLHAWSLVGEPILTSRLTGVSRRRLRAIRDETVRERRRRLERLVETVLPGRSVTIELRKGRPRSVIRSVARWMEPDVIVLGSSGRTGLARLLLGNLAERLLGAVPASVMVVREPPVSVPVPLGAGALHDTVPGRRTMSRTAGAEIVA